MSGTVIVIIAVASVLLAAYGLAEILARRRAALEHGRL